jgi:hypothetical protein
MLSAESFPRPLFIAMTTFPWTLTSFLFGLIYNTFISVLPIHFPSLDMSVYKCQLIGLRERYSSSNLIPVTV